MEKIITTYMQNPNAANLAAIKKHNNKRPMAACLLPMNMQVILNQILRENP